MEYLDKGELMEIYKNLSLENLDGEIWKKIDEYDGDYQVSIYGRIKSFKQYKDGKILKQNTDNKGYLYVRLYKNKKYKSKRIHLLLYESFCEKLNGNECIHHSDKNSMNNSYDNLQKMTRSEHIILHNKNNKNMFGKKLSKETKRKMSESKKGEKHPRSKFKNSDIIYIRKLLFEENLTLSKIAKIYNVSPMTISLIKNNKRWK